MRVFTVTNERSLADLRARIQLAEANSGDRRAAYAAIIAANPGLEDTPVVPGMTIVVPSVPKAKQAVGAPVGSATAALVAAARVALDALLERAHDAEQRRVVEVEMVTAALKAARTAARRRGEPPAERLELVGEDIKAELALGAARREALTAISTEWTAGLDRLAARIERRP